MKCTNDLLRETMAEFLGTFLLTLGGNSLLGALVTERASGTVAGPLGWGLALAIAVSVAGGVSGCHANPALTVAIASVGKTPWRSVLPYMAAQYFGAFLSSVLVYLVYLDGIYRLDGGIRQLPPSPNATAQIFATYPQEHVGTATALIDQIVGTGLLAIAIAALCDPHNKVTAHVQSLLAGVALAGTIFAFPSNMGAPLNPARDLGPRIFTALAGWGTEVFSFRHYNYFWVPIVGPHIGALIGMWTYRFLIELHWPVDSYDLPTEVKPHDFTEKKKTVPLEIRKTED